MVGDCVYNQLYFEFYSRGSSHCLWSLLCEDLTGMMYKHRNM